MFFSSNPAKWAILIEEVGLSLQSKSDTCWSLHVTAIRTTGRFEPMNFGSEHIPH
jgi:hypothetical protein